MAAGLRRSVSAIMSLATNFELTLDRYLLHNPYIIPSLEELQKAWKGLEAVKASGKAKSIGVSNMQRHHIEAILEIAAVVPAINQLEFHPYLQRSNDFVPWMREQGIEVSSFKTLAPITVGKGGPLDGVLDKIAEAHSVSTDTVIMRWALNQNIVPVTTTGKAARMDQYIAAADLRLNPDEQEEITQVGLTHHFRWWGKSFFEPDDKSRDALFSQMEWPGR
ncbi:hypothetical protein ACHAPT_010971 [Fusarium lateritium]